MNDLLKYGLVAIICLGLGYLISIAGTEVVKPKAIKTQVTKEVQRKPERTPEVKEKEGMRCKIVGKTKYFKTKNGIKIKSNLTQCKLDGKVSYYVSYILDAVPTNKHKAVFISMCYRATQSIFGRKFKVRLYSHKVVGEKYFVFFSLEKSNEISI